MRQTLNLLHEKFAISRGADINRPPRSRDLTPLDFSRVYVKSRIYAHEPQTVAENEKPFIYSD